MSIQGVIRRCQQELADNIQRVQRGGGVWQTGGTHVGKKWYIRWEMLPSSPTKRNNNDWKLDPCQGPIRGKGHCKTMPTYSVWSPLKKHFYPWWDWSLPGWQLTHIHTHPQYMGHEEPLNGFNKNDVNLMLWPSQSSHRNPLGTRRETLDWRAVDSVLHHHHQNADWCNISFGRIMLRWFLR